MLAVSLKEGKLALREIFTPVPGSGHVLVRTLACASPVLQPVTCAAAQLAAVRSDAAKVVIIQCHGGGRMEFLSKFEGH